jgi:hypothetical protein
MHRDEAATAGVADPFGGRSRECSSFAYGSRRSRGGTTLGLRSVVEHLQSGDSVAFSDEDALLAFLREAGRTM